MINKTFALISLLLTVVIFVSIIYFEQPWYWMIIGLLFSVCIYQLMSITSPIKVNDMETIEVKDNILVNRPIITDIEKLKTNVVTDNSILKHRPVNDIKVM